MHILRVMQKMINSTNFLRPGSMEVGPDGLWLTTVSPGGCKREGDEDRRRRLLC